MHLLARGRGGHAQELLAGRPRSHGGERDDFGHLRVLQRELQVRAGGGAGRGRHGSQAMTAARARAAVLFFVIAGSTLVPAAAWAQACPAALADARRLVLVTAETMNSTA